MAKKPLLFGDKTFDADRIDELQALGGNWDQSYVPGYSEARRLADMNGEQHKGPRAQWVRVGTTSATDVDYSERIGFEMLGYQAVGEDDLEHLGWGMPPAAHVGPDGLIRRGDLALAYVDDKRAEKNRAFQKRKNEDFYSMPDGAIESTERHVGRGSLESAQAALKRHDTR